MPTPFVPATDIQEVIDRLQVIIDDSIANNNAYGIFTSLYQIVTRKIKEGIDQGDIFEDNARMEKLDVIFANRYLEAYQRYREGQSVTMVWQLSFDSLQRFSRHVVLQEMLVGVNAHMNFDLGIAAAEVMEGKDFEALEKDFGTINIVLATLIDGVKDDLVKLSPRFGWILRWFKGQEDAMMDFSIRKSRESAWKFAEDLARASDRKDPKIIDRRDRKMTKLGQRITGPGLIGRLVIWWVKRAEEKDMGIILNEFLNNVAHHARFSAPAER